MQRVWTFLSKWRTQTGFLFTVIGAIIIISLTQQWIDNAKLRNIATMQTDKLLDYKILEFEKLFELADRQTKRLEFCNLIEPPQGIRPIKKYIMRDFHNTISNDDFPTCSLTLRTVLHFLKQVEVLNNFVLAITSTSQEFDTESFSQLPNARAKIIAFEDKEGKDTIYG